MIGVFLTYSSYYVSFATRIESEWYGVCHSSRGVLNGYGGIQISIYDGEGPSYRVEKNLFSENQKSKLGFDWSECQHATHGDFDISEILFSAKKSWGTFS